MRGECRTGTKRCVRSTLQSLLAGTTQKLSSRVQALLDARGVCRKRITRIIDNSRQTFRKDLPLPLQTVSEEYIHKRSISVRGMQEAHLQVPSMRKHDKMPRHMGCVVDCFCQFTLFCDKVDERCVKCDGTITDWDDPNPYDDSSVRVAWCQSCGEKGVHLLNQKNTFSADVFECTLCHTKNTACTTCKQGSIMVPVVSRFFFFSHKI